MLEVTLLTAVFIYLILVLCTSHVRLLNSGEIPVFTKNRLETGEREGRGVRSQFVFLVVCCEKNALLFSWQPHICPSWRIEGEVLYYRITKIVYYSRTIVEKAE